jgi:anti-sigma B factor antagonist
MEQWTIERTMPGRVKVRGEIDLASSRDLRRCLEAELDDPPREVEVDLSGVDFIDSNGLHTLLHAHQYAGARGSQLVVVAPSAPVMRVLELTGCHNILTIASSPEARSASAAD